MDRRRRVILGTAGHIDHGKTTLVRALTGVDTDRLPEEKRRGITIELGFAPLVLEGVGTIGVVDVPGHEAFVRTMVAGATGIDLALVVVAADEGVMPQTREHLEILRLLGVTRGVVALTKADLVDDEWLALIEEDVRAATRAALPDAAIVATSAQTGAGLPELRAALLEAAQSVPARMHDDLFRLPIDRAFTIKGTGTVVTGTVWSGSIARDESVRVLPGGRVARVRGIQGHGAQRDQAEAGARTALALGGVDVADVPRGSTLVGDSEWRPTTLARAEVAFLPEVEIELRPRTRFRIHIGTTEVGARIVARDRDDSTNAPFAARLVFDEPVVLRAGDRFVIRTSAPLDTIGGGVITDPYAPRRARLWPPGLSAAERLERLALEAGGNGLEVRDLAVRIGLPPRDAEAAVRASDLMAVIGTRVVMRTIIEELERTVLDATRAYHETHPLEPGIPSHALRGRLRAAPEIVDAVIAGQLNAGIVQSSAGYIHLPGWTPTPTGAQEHSLKRLRERLSAAGAEPPSTDELAAEFGGDAGPLLRFLERTGEVVQVEPSRYFAASQLQALVERLRSSMANGSERTPGELRDALGLSRKFLIPFLEYSDRVGYTRRGSTGRVWQGA